MSFTDWTTIIFVAISLILFVVSTVMHGKSRVVSTIAGWISSAEAIYGAGTGTVKMSYVVGKLYAMIPAVARPFLPQSLLQTFVQTIFDKMQAYAALQIKQAAKVLTTDTAAQTATSAATVK